MTLAYDKHAIESVRHIDDNGFMHVQVSNITKESVNPYYGYEIPNYQEYGLKPNLIYYGYRPADELEKAKETFNNLPLLSKHVKDGSDKKNHHLRVGSLGTDAQFNNPYLTNSLVIYDKDAQDGIINETKKELSCAYRYTPVVEIGNFDGQRYDFRMTNIRGNHVALVHEGRAGSDVVVADSSIGYDREYKRDEFDKKETDISPEKGENPSKSGEKCSLKNKIGVIMSKNKIKDFIQKLTSPQLAMDEGIEDELKEIIREEIKECSQPEEVENQINEDAERTDKRKLIDEIGGILKGKVDEEIWRTVIGKIEKASYSDSETSADDEKTVSCSNDEKSSKSDNDDMKGAMDSAVIRSEIMQEFKNKYQACQDVRPLVGHLDMMAYDSADDIYAKALSLKGYNPKDYDRISYKGMVDVLKNAKNTGFAYDNKATKNDVLEKFPELQKIKLGV